jgi:hypothetical protein
MSALFNPEGCKQFLLWRYGDQPAQVVYGKYWTGEQVAPQDWDALLKRVADQQLFFHVGELSDSWSDPASHESKCVTSASNKHVVGTQYIPFDVDVAKFLKNPPADKDAPINKNAVADWESNVHYQKESARIIGIIEKCWERMGLEPSVWWHSGGGIQGLFKLDRVIGNDQASNLTMRLFMLLGGDPNVAKPSQILRVPGSVNPKTSYGRKPTTSGPARFRRDMFGRDASGDVIAVGEFGGGA